MWDLISSICFLLLFLLIIVFPEHILCGMLSAIQTAIITIYGILWCIAGIFIYLKKVVWNCFSRLDKLRDEIEKINDKRKG